MSDHSYYIARKVKHGGNETIYRIEIRGTTYLLGLFIKPEKGIPGKLMLSSEQGRFCVPCKTIKQAKQLAFEHTIRKA